MSKLKIRTTVKTLFFLVLSIGVFTAIDITTSKNNKLITNVNAYSAECPDGLSDSECLDYLKDQASKVNKEIGDLQDQLKSEEYEQLGFYEKINYKQSLISQKEAEISELEILIEQNNIEIRILLREIEILQGEIDVAAQEIEMLENTLEKRVRITYKYNRISPLELIFNANDFDSMSRKIQYLQKTKEKDAELLENMSAEIASLNSHQQNLAQKKYDVQEKRDSIEENKTDLFSEKSKLVSERAVLDILLAESKLKEQEAIAQLTANTALQNAIDQQIIERLNAMIDEDDFASGDYIPAGGLVGYMGNTGNSQGAHLHFSYSTSTEYWCRANIDPFASGYLIRGPDYYSIGPQLTKSYIHSGSMILPAESPAILTQYPHNSYFGPALDIWHPRASDPTYNVKIYASHSGKILRYTDQSGGKFAIIWNSTSNISSCYLHLK